MRSIARFTTLAFLALGCTAGCEQTGQSRPYPPDPLLQCWKPAECKAKEAQPALFAQAEPNLPSLPEATALAQNKQDSGRPASDAGTAESQPKRTPPVHAMPVSRKKHSGSNELVGHAHDFHWLIGTLEKNERGQPCLRFAPANADKSEVGLVPLLPETDLAAFVPGDLLLVEGELSNSSVHQNPNSSQSSRVYQVRSVRLLEKAG